MLYLAEIKLDDNQLCSIWYTKFKEAMITKAPYTKRWLTYIDAYRGDYFKHKNIPEYKSNMVSNYIFSTVETIRPIMLDNDPKFQAVPRQPDGLQFSHDLQEAFSYEWDREGMNRKMYRELINTLTIGTTIFFIPWDAINKNVKGIPVNPFNFFPDPLATTIEDAEYLIYATYKNVHMLKNLYPEHREKLSGGQINYSELVLDKDRNARINNQVLVLEIWAKDYAIVEEIQGNERLLKKRYPKGRVITMCPELGIILEDKPNPYNDGAFPFELLKDYDMPDQFWGEGEVAQLLSPQEHINALNNAIIDCAKTTANMPWIIDKNSGIGVGKITGRPGLVIRKNPGTDVKRDQAPSMPQYVVNAVEVYKQDIESISGIYDSIKGDSATGVYTAQGILALQEAGQSRIRLKVKLLEDALGRIAQKWYSRMKQYWKEDRWIGVTKNDGTYDVKIFTKSILQYDFSLRITAGSTMPVNRSAMLDLMIRLAQTPMPDGQNLVDREAVTQYLPEEIKSALLDRMKGENQNIEQINQAIQQITQELQQFYQQDQKDDQQTMSTLEELTSAIEKVNQQILQLQSKHDKLEQDKVEEEKTNKLKDDSYNKGYLDAEKILKDEKSDQEITNDKNASGNKTGGLPEELLQGLESMSDDELQLLMEKNPDLLDIIQQSEQLGQSLEE